MRKMLLSTVVVAALTQGCATLSDVTPAPAQANMNYVMSAENNVVKIDGGNCLRAVGFASDNVVVECQASAKGPVAETPAPTLAQVSFNGKALFAFDSAVLTSLGQQELNSLVSKLKRHGGIGTVSVVGHADSVGTEGYNQSLSEQRAAAVKTYLSSALSSGVALSASGMGESAPVADNSSELGRKLNRRVEVQIKAKVAQ